MWRGCQRLADWKWIVIFVIYWHIGNGLVDWYWIGGSVMDRQLGIELANWPRIRILTVGWYKIGIGLVD